MDVKKKRPLAETTTPSLSPSTYSDAKYIADFSSFWLNSSVFALEK